MLRCGETVAEEEDDDEYAKLVRRMNPPRYVYVRWAVAAPPGPQRCQSRRTSSEFVCSLLPRPAVFLWIADRLSSPCKVSFCSLFSVVSFCKLLRDRERR